LGYDCYTEEAPRLLANKPLSLQEYAERHKDNDTVTVTRPLTNFCPTCAECVADSHDGPQGISCEEYIAKRDEKAQLRALKDAKKLAAYCAKDKARRERKFAPKQRSERFSSWLTDRAILSSRGNDTKKIDKILKEKYGYRVRKSTSQGDDTCPPQEFKYVPPKEQLL